ncbi:MAG: DUF2089 domain-containing protein [FCB group bacterium]|nr:DUF2089 domain-containing protein [FCB group bacterium]
MNQEWQELTRMTGGRDFLVERIRIKDTGVAIEGEFELPPLFDLSAEDQVFLAAFVRSHGSIKEMERYFGVSYPTIKNRLNRLAEKFDFIEIKPAEEKSEVLDRLDRGEISVQQALENLKSERGE